MSDLVANYPHGIEYDAIVESFEFRHLHPTWDVFDVYNFLEIKMDLELDKEKMEKMFREFYDFHVY